MSVNTPPFHTPLVTDGLTTSPTWITWFQNLWRGNFASLTTTGNVTVGGNITVAGTSTITGNETVSGNLAVSGNETITGNLTVTGNESVTGTITPSTTKGIVGTTLADSAQAGSVGEYLTNTTTGTALTTGVAANATSLALTPGDWDVGGNVLFNAAAGTITNVVLASISATSATVGAFGSVNSLGGIATTAGQKTQWSTPIVRVNIAANTTYYLVALCNFTTSTMTCDGFIRARRVR